MLAAKADTIDVFFAPYSTIQRFSRAGWLADLTGILAEAKINKGDFVPNSFEGATFKGKVYGVPWGADSEMLGWRPSMYTAAGLTREPRTWDEMMEYGKKLTKAPDRFGFGMSVEKSNVWNETNKFIAAAGGKAYEYDTAEAKQALKFMKDLIVNGATQPTAAQEAYGALWAPFIDGKYASWIMWDLWLGGLALNAKVKGDMNFAWQPAGPAGVKTVTHCWSWCINPFTKKMDKAVEWIKYISSVPAVKIHATRGATPALMTLWKDADVQKVVPQLPFLASQMDKMQDMVYIPYKAITADIDDIVNGNLSSYFTNQMSLDDFATKTMAAIKPMLLDEGYTFSK
jgi:ABC-type glycerol-3-phosphate transport system substrate-binding protein